MSKLTPGPWNLHEIAPDDPSWEAFEIWNEHADGKMIANGAGEASMRVFGVANARLIAAAPDLLHVAEMMRDADEDCKRDGLPRIPDAARSAINAAISKARGAS